MSCSPGYANNLTGSWLSLTLSAKVGYNRKIERQKLGTLETLKRCEIFLGLDDSDLRKIVALPSCQERVYQPREIIFEAGEKAEHFYVLDEGRVNLFLRTPPSSSEAAGQTVVRIITQGGIFGWAALVSPHLRVVSAVSEQSSRVISISGSELRTLFDRDYRLGYEVMNCLVRVIGSRVWNIEQLLMTGRRSPFCDRPGTGR